MKLPEGLHWCALLSQEKVSVAGRTYRPDFVVSMDAHPGTYGSDVFTPYPQVAIELDGHEFHERTKEQVTYRNQRDRALQGAGWKVLHVSGSELHLAPEACVAEIMRLVCIEWAGFWAAYWREVERKKVAC